MRRFILLTGLFLIPHLRAQQTDQTKLTTEEETRLARDKVLITRQEMNQCFTPYLSGTFPRFITSDAVLNAYHVLFEETLRQQEEFLAGHLKSVCRDLWMLLRTAERMYQGDMKQVAAAKKRARFTIGVTLRMLDEELDGCEDDLRREIEAEAAAVKKANGQRKPVPFGAPEPDFLAFDYSLFKPMGFYAGSERLRQYFRALRWLQIVPFRLNRDEELLAFHMLDMLLQSPWQAGGVKIDPKHLPLGLDGDVHDRLWHSVNHRHLFVWEMGVSLADADISDSKFSSGDNVPVKVDAEFFSQHRPEPGENDAKLCIAGNDRVRSTPTNPAEREGRVFSAFRLPEDDALTFLSRSSHRGISPGMAFAAWLSVPEAEKKLGEELLAGVSLLRPRMEDYGDPKLKEMAWWQRVTSGHAGCLLQYHVALRLLAEQDARAPDFMRGEAWKNKTLQTISASWAQERHAWVLQAKPEVHVLSAAPREKGFVEPAPEFFLRLACSAEQMGNMAFESEINLDPVGAAVDEILTEVSGMRESVKTDSSKEAIFSHIWCGHQTALDYGAPVEACDPEDASVKDVLKLANALENHAARMREQARPGSMLWERVQSKRIHTTRLWHRLETLCLRLAALAEKQLEKTPLNDEDGALVEHVGHELAEIMMYRGQAMVFPLDDAPRIARISSDPATGEVMHVGIGRPRLMFVLYPWEGREIRCRGVVMPYHEVRAHQSLSDDEWRKRQEGGAREGIPSWLKDYVPADKIQHLPAR
jgi:hypothetical protein